MLVPVLRNIPIINSKYNEFMRNRNSLFEFIEIQISEHEKLPRNKDYTDEASDFVFAFFKEIEQRKNKSSDEDHSFVYVCMYLNHYFLNLSRKQLISVCIDLWFAGFDTSTTTIKWAFVYMLNNNEVQHRIHVEMDEHIGRDRLIEMADRQQLPYTCAVLNVSVSVRK
jgi:cytochrome P450 family 2 subfamily U polypeptide 1